CGRLRVAGLGEPLHAEGDLRPGAADRRAGHHLSAPEDAARPGATDGHAVAADRAEASGPSGGPERPGVRLEPVRHVRQERARAQDPGDLRDLGYPALGERQEAEPGAEEEPRPAAV